MFRNTLLVCVTCVLCSAALGQTSAPATQEKQAATAPATMDIQFSGKVTDADDKALAGVPIRAYQFKYDDISTPRLELLGQAASAADGTYSLSAKATTEEPSPILVLAREEGLACDWRYIDSVKPKESFSFTLGKSQSYAGVVVDEAGKPLAGAEVKSAIMVEAHPRPRNISGIKPLDWLMPKTDAKGRFEIKDIPVGARAEFTASAPGRATISTYRTSGGPYGQYIAGRTDIRIILPPEARVEGRAVQEGTDKPVGGVGLAISSPRSGHLSCVSGPDGRFQFSGLCAGVYSIRPGSPKVGPAPWVGPAVQVAVKEGRTAGNVKVQLNKGGLLEITVCSEATKEPIAGATVSAGPTGGGEWFSGLAGKDGKAVVRVPEGAYRLEVYCAGYLQLRSTGTSPEVSIALGQTQKVSLAMRTAPTPHGVVLDPSGKPAAGVLVRTLPGGSEEVLTGKDGKFALRPQSWDYPPGTLLVLARDAKRNLCAIVETPPGDKPIELKLTKGVSFVGKVTDSDGKPLAGASIVVQLIHANYGSPISDERCLASGDGSFTVTAVPGGYRYSVQATADDFGLAWAEAPLEEDQTGSVELAPLALSPAKLSISGAVLDADGNPVPNAQVNVNSQRQASRFTQTDKNGKFVLSKIVEGDMQVYARDEGQGRSSYGSVQAKGGDKDVKIILGQNSGGRLASVAPLLRSAVGKPLPKFDSLGIKEQPQAGKRVLVCFWDIDERPSRRCIAALGAKLKALKQQGVQVIAVHASPVDPKGLAQWLSSAKVDLPVQAISEGQVDAKLARWGVANLPWLILADEKGIVRAEGFDLEKLDELLGLAK